MPRIEIVRDLGISPSLVSRWNSLRESRGSVAPKPRPGRTPKIGPERLDEVIAQVAATPDATLAMHCARCQESHGVPASTATMSRLFAKLVLTLKKRL